MTAEEKKIVCSKIAKLYFQLEHSSKLYRLTQEEAAMQKWIRCKARFDTAYALANALAGGEIMAWLKPYDLEKVGREARAEAASYYEAYLV